MLIQSNYLRRYSREDKIMHTKKRKAYTKSYRNPKIISSREGSRRKESSGLLKKFLAITLLIFITAGLNYLFTNDYLRIKHIKVSGDNAFEEEIKNITEEVLNESRFLLFKKNNYLLLKKDDLAERIKSKIPEVKEISIHKKFPDIIELNIQERQAAIGWETQEKKYFLDEDGYILKETNDFEGLLVVKDTSNLSIDQENRVVYPNFIYFVKDMSEKLKKLKINIKTAEISETTFILSIYTPDEYKIMFNTTKSLSEQLSKLEEALEYIGESKNKLDYIDLTISNKAVYKFK